MDAAKAVLRGKFIAIQAYLKKKEKSEINNSNSRKKKKKKDPKQQKEINHKDQSRNERETKKKKKKEKMNETKRQFFEKINQIDKSLARLIKKGEIPNQ